MVDVLVIFDSKTHNTEKAASYVLEGVQAAGVTGEMKKVESVKPSDIQNARGIIIGSYCVRDACSANIDSLVGKMQVGDVVKKPGAVFGTYRFSGGQVTKLEAEMANLGMNIIAKGVNALNEPDAQAAFLLKELGKKVGDAVKE